METNYLSDNQNGSFDQTSIDQHSNLNLNQNNQSLHFDNVQLKSAINNSRKNENYDFTNLVDLQTGKVWKKSNKNLSTSFLNLNQKSEEQQEFKKSKSVNNSTLSLHIAAYENLFESTTDAFNDDDEEEDLKNKNEKATLIKKWEASKHRGTSSFVQNPFEFPRQQNEDGNIHPEIMQFRASQHLRNPNEVHLTTMEPIQDLQLRQIRKFRAFPSQNLAATEFGRKLVGVSSRYGFAVIAGPDNRLISVKTSDLQALQSDDFKELDTYPKRDLDFFNLQAEIFSIEFNSDGRVLAVAANTPNGPFVYVFDGFTFHPSYSQQPFPLQSMRLSSNNNANITAFEWNPCIPEMFATATTDGLTTIQYTLNNPKSYSILGNQTLKSAVTCISWSPKGKQLTVGDAEGKVHQLKPELLPVRTIDAPPSLAGLGNPPYRCVGLSWLSTTEWAVVHSSTTNYLNLSLLTGKKNQPITWDSWSGVLPPLSDPSAPRSVNFLPLFDWQFVLATSTCLTNAVTFGNNGIVWKPWELPEPFVINTPLSASHKDTFIVGSSFDFTSTKPVVVERDGTQVPPQPIIYTLTSDGVLLLYHVTSLNPARPALTKPIEPCDLNATKNGDQPMGYQPRPAAALSAQPASTAAPTKQTSLFGTPSTQAPSQLFGAPSTQASTNLFGAPSAFSSLAKTDSPSTSTTTMQNTVASNTAEVEEAEKKKREAELKAQAEEKERQKRLAAEEEQRKKEAAEAEAQRQQAEEEAKRKEQTAALEATFKANLDGLVSKLNDYSRAVDALRALKMKLMQNTKLNIEFDAHLEPMLKSIGYVSIIGNDIDESLTRLRQVSNSIQRSAKESQQFLLKDSKELPTPEWVLELSDDLDELEQREFIVVEKLQKAEAKMEKIAKLLKEGKGKKQPIQLTPEQQQKLEKDSKTMLIFVRKLWERIKILRQQVRDVNFNEKVMKAKQAIRSAGGEQNISILNESDAYLDTSDNNASLMASELIASISLVDDRKAKDGTLEPVKNNIQNLLRHLDQASTRPPKLVNVVPIDKFISTQKPKEISANSSILKPKVAEAHKNLIEHLMKVQSPRTIAQNVPAAQPRQPLSLFGNKPVANAIVPQPTVSTPQQQQPTVSTSQQKNLFGKGNISFAAAPGTPTSAASPFGNLSGIGQQPKTSTPITKPLFGSNPAFSPQNSASPLFASPLAASPLATTTTTFAPKKDEAKDSEEQKRKEAEEEQKKKDVAEAEAKKKAEEEAEKKKKEAEEKAKKDAEEQERLKKLAEEEEKKKAVAEAEAQRQQAEEEEKKKAAELEAQKQAAEEEAKKKQEAAATVVTTAATTPPVTFSFKPVAAAASPTVAGAPATTSTAPINFSFKPAATAAPAMPVKSESNADIGMEDDGLDSALAGTNICSPTNAGNAFGSGTSGGGFSSFGGNAFGQQQPATKPANPFGGGFSAAATAPANNASPFGGTSAFGSNVKNPFGGGNATTTNTGFSSFGNKPNAFGGAFSQQQQPLATTATTPQKNPFGGTTSSPFSSGTSAFAQTNKSPFAAGSSTTGSGFSAFGNKSFGAAASPSQNTSSFGGTSAFGGGSAFGSTASPFASAASGSAFGGGTSAFGQATKSPFAAATNTATSPSTATAFGGGGGFSAFGNKAGGFGALAQQATSNSPQNTSSFGSTSAFGGGSAFGTPRQ